MGRRRRTVREMELAAAAAPAARLPRRPAPPGEVARMLARRDLMANICRAIAEGLRALSPAPP